MRDSQKSHLLNTSQWGENWSGNPDVDLFHCKKLSEILTEFIAHLIEEGYAYKTISRHKNSLNILGYEIIKKIWLLNENFLNPDMGECLDAEIHCEGGPLISGHWPTEEDQRAMDATCKKLFKFRQQAALLPTS